jgi:hypothetical protein
MSIENTALAQKVGRSSKALISDTYSLHEIKICVENVYCTLGWDDIGTRTKVPLRFVTYLSKLTKINEKSVLTQ